MTETRLVDVDAAGGTSIRISVCAKCGSRSFPPVFLGCEHCGAPGNMLEEAWLPAKGKLLASATVPHPDGAFRVASVKLDDGPAVRAIVEGDIATGDVVTGSIPDQDEQSPPIIFRAET